MKNLAVGCANLSIKFTKKTTIHGVSHISRGDSICHTFIWFILITLSLAALIYFLVYNVLNYLYYDVIGNENAYITVPLELPTITICNNVELQISTYKFYSFNSWRDRNIQKAEILKTAKKGFLYGISFKLFTGMPEEAFLHKNGFLVFVQLGGLFWFF